MDYYSIISTISKYALVVIAFAFIINILKDILYYIKSENKEKIYFLRYKIEDKVYLTPIKGEISVGRSKENDIVLQDMSVSKNHFHIKKIGEKYVIIDLKSANGTRVNGENVNKKSLKNHDLIEVGSIKMRFEGKITNV